MLTFHYKEGTVQIDADSAGLRKLIGVLEKLLKDGPSHMHLCQPPRGHELDEVNPWGEQSLSEVIINNVGDED